MSRRRAISANSFMLILLSQYHKSVLLDRMRVPAAEQICALILLAPDRKLVRDQRGYWNHASLLTDVKSVNPDGTYKETVRWFNGGYKGRTIDRLIEKGRLRATKFDTDARPTEVEWVPL